MRSSSQIIKSFEADALKKRNLASKIADWLSSSFGTTTFLLINLIIFILWLVVNSGVIPGEPFDPFPFILLITAVSLEAIILSIIVLMSQNRQNYINSQRSELNLQVDLIAEREITKILKLVSELHKHHKVKAEKDEELEQMLEQIDTSYIERQLSQQISRSQLAPKIFEKVKKVPTDIVQTIEQDISKDIGKS